MRTGSIRVAEISLSAISHNVQRVREMTGGNVIAVVKADGYGHSAVLAARGALAGGAVMLGTADLEEAMKLREAGIDAPILSWLHGVHADFRGAVQRGIDVGVSHLAQLTAVAEAARELAAVGERVLPAHVQLKLDTGLSRNGAGRGEWQELFAAAAQLEQEGIVRVRGLFSHLANAGEEADLAQAAEFDAAIELARQAGLAPELLHLAATAATFTSPRLHYNTVRVGLAIYGLSPFEGKTSAALGLRPAMMLRGEIVQLRDVPAGTGVSYGFNHVCEVPTTLALVPMGYADGMPRALNGAGAWVSVAGEHRPIIGRIGMDQCIIDVGPLAGRLQLGDPVVFFGDPEKGHPPVETWAGLMRTINYEIIAGIGQRVVRVAAADDAAGESVAAAAVGAPGFEDTAAGGGTSAWTREVATPEEMHALGEWLGGVLGAGDVLVLSGPLGAGKTTLTRGIGEGMGVRGPVQSPTFVVARTHPSLSGGAPLVHVDAYRLGSPDELEDLDLPFESAAVVVEWGEGMVDPGESWLEVRIERAGGAELAAGDAQGAAADEAGAVEESPGLELAEARRIHITGHGSKLTEWLEATASGSGMHPAEDGE